MSPGDDQRCLLSMYDDVEFKLNNNALLKVPDLETNECWNVTKSVDGERLGEMNDIWDNFKENPDYKGDCVEELMLAVLVLLIVRMVVGNIMEYLTIKLKNKKAAVDAVKEAMQNVESNLEKMGVSQAGLQSVSEVSQAEEQMQQDQYEKFQLVVFPCTCRARKFSYMKAGGTLLDYDEIIIQFGYVVLFVAAFPLAPLLGLLNNIVEIRLDSHKITKMTRQPHPAGARDIGHWLHCLEIMAWMSIFSNVLIVTLYPTKHGLLDFEDPFQQIAAFVLFEHALLFMKAVLAYIIPDFPEHIKQHVSRQTLIHEVYLRQKVSL